MKKIILLLLSILNKAILIFLSIIFIGYYSIHFNFFGFKDKLYSTYPNLELRRLVFYKKDVTKKMNNDYNVKFLPETQFINLNFKKKKLNFLPQHENTYFKSFYIEVIKDMIWIIDVKGKFFEIKSNQYEDIYSEKNLEANAIDSNLDPKKVLGTLIHKENIYISFYTETKDCKKLQVAFAKVNNNYLDFQNFFTSKECGKHDIYGGKMQYFTHNNLKGLLLTAVDVPSHLVGNLNDNPQKDSSIFGKILFIDFDKKNHIIFSRGHRNPSGLFAENDLVIATEHGPWSGDEINKITFNKNYGWPISSYGEKFDPIKQNKEGITSPVYLKNHDTNGFEEPIFSYVPAIGISELLKLPNDFSNFWIDNFLISSLWGQSLHRVQFDKGYNKVIFSEKIFVGERTRDIEYHKKMKAVLMSFEQSGELGFLTNKGLKN